MTMSSDVAVYLWENFYAVTLAAKLKYFQLPWEKTRNKKLKAIRNEKMKQEASSERPEESFEGMS